MMWLLLYRESVGGRENGARKEGVIGDGAGTQYLKDVRLRRRRRGGGACTTSQRTSSAFLAGNKNRGFSTPPTLNEPSPCISTRVFVESGSIVQSMPFDGIKEIL